MLILRTARAIHKWSAQCKRAGEKIAIVPTMGYLHDGHISLVKRARKAVGKSGFVVVTIYVNPTQFGPKEDLSRYPRDFKRDVQMCTQAGVDVIFAPLDSEMYPGGLEQGFSTYIVEEKLSQRMEGASRPTHFRGVTTVVGKLFNLVGPDVAVFGAKDFQQAAVVRRMIRDLNFPIRLIVAPTHRESDGLAMSSRNKYLTEEQRSQAVALIQSIQLAKKLVAGKNISTRSLILKLSQFIGKFSEAKLDYIEVFNPETLEPRDTAGKGSQIAMAVFYGKTRLIDNGRL